MPSLIPLLFALTMFFYVFTFTWNTFDQRGRVFEDALATLRVSGVLKGNNYLRGIDSFEERCNEAQGIRRVNFLSGLLELSTGPDQQFEPVDVEDLEDKFFEVDNKKFICTNAGEERPEYTSSGLTVRSFPIALEFKNEETDAFYIRPMLLVVVTWR